MLKKVILLLLVVGSAITSCSKSKVEDALGLRGTLRLECVSTNPYQVIVTQEPKGKVLIDTRMEGKTSKNHSLHLGIYTVEVKQLSGYVLYPTVETYTITLSDSNKEETIRFPK